MQQNVMANLNQIAIHPMEQMGHIKLILYQPHATSVGSIKLCIYIYI